MKTKTRYILFIINCTNALTQFVKYTHIEVIKRLENYAQYTTDKIHKSKYGSEECSFWHSSNINIHSGIKHAKIKEDKCLYLGWKTAGLYTNSDSELIPILIFLDIESANIIKLVNIITNPYIDADNYSIKLFKEHLLDFVNNIGIYFDFSELKNIDNGKWYLNMITKL